MDRIGVTSQPSDRLVRRGMRLSHLRLMMVLEETGQISAAASMLAMSQPAASRLCAELEKISGVKLYERHARGIALTAYGQRLAKRARTILRELDEADREIAELRSGLGGKVQIGAVTGAAVEMVLPAIKQARVNYPRIDISVEVGTSDTLIADLDAGRIDFYLGRILTPHDPRQYRSELVGEEPVRLIVRPSHPLLRQADIRLEDCIEYDWVLQPEGSLLRHTVETYLAGKGLSLPGKILSTSSMLLTLIVISQTNAVAPVAKSVAEFFGGREGLRGRLEILPAAEDIAISPYSIVALAGHELSPASQLLYDLIRRRVHV